MDAKGARNEYDELLDRLQAECKAGQTSSCSALYGTSKPTPPSAVQDPVLWGVIITAWIVIAIPAYFAETARQSNPHVAPEEKTHHEGRFTRLSLWWSVGLVLLLALWKIGAPAVGGGVAMAVYLFGSLTLRSLLRSRARSAVIQSLSKRRTRIAVSILFLWFLLVQAASVVFDWYDGFSVGQLVGINIFPPLLLAVAYACLRWVRSAKVE